MMFLHRVSFLLSFHSLSLEILVLSYRGIHSGRCFHGMCSGGSDSHSIEECLPELSVSLEALSHDDAHLMVAR